MIVEDVVQLVHHGGRRLAMLALASEILSQCSAKVQLVIEAGVDEELGSGPVG